MKTVEELGINLEDSGRLLDVKPEKPEEEKEEPGIKEKEAKVKKKPELTEEEKEIQKHIEAGKRAFQMAYRSGI